MTEVIELGRGERAAAGAFERCVRDGGVALFPADTVYGLACDPSNVAAVERINSLKGRSRDKPSAVMFFAPLAMRELLSTLGPQTRDALAALLPGPVTAVVTNPQGLYPLACGTGAERLGLRLVEGPLAGVGLAVLQTSANRSGRPPSRRLEDVDRAILAGVDLAIDGGELGGEASTVVDLSAIEEQRGWTVLRRGAMPAEAVEERLRPLLSSPDDADRGRV